MRKSWGRCHLLKRSLNGHKTYYQKSLNVFCVSFCVSFEPCESTCSGFPVLWEFECVSPAFFVLLLGISDLWRWPCQRFECLPLICELLPPASYLAAILLDLAIVGSLLPFGLIPSPCLKCLSYHFLQRTRPLCNGWSFGNGSARGLPLLFGKRGMVALSVAKHWQIKTSKTRMLKNFIKVKMMDVERSSSQEQKRWSRTTLCCTL